MTIASVLLKKSGKRRFVGIKMIKFNVSTKQQKNQWLSCCYGIGNILVIERKKWTS